jgi:hypothetical protein
LPSRRVSSDRAVSTKSAVRGRKVCTMTAGYSGTRCRGTRKPRPFGPSELPNGAGCQYHLTAARPAT